MVSNIKRPKWATAKDPITKREDRVPIRDHKTVKGKTLPDYANVDIGEPLEVSKYTGKQITKKIDFLPDGSVKYTTQGGLVFNLTKDEYKAATGQISGIGRTNNSPNVRAVIADLEANKEQLVKDKQREEAEQEAFKQVVQQEEAQKIREEMVNANFEGLGTDLPSSDVELAESNILNKIEALGGVVAGYGAYGATGAALGKLGVGGAAAASLPLAIGIGTAVTFAGWKLKSEGRRVVSKDYNNFNNALGDINELITTAKNTGYPDSATAMTLYNQHVSNINAIASSLKERTDSKVDDFIYDAKDEYDDVLSFIDNLPLIEAQLKAAYVNPKPRALATGEALQ